MIGIRFEVKNEYNNFLKKILASIDVQKYEWDIITDDIIKAEKLRTNDGIFAADRVNGLHFLDCISKGRYYMIFVDLKAFPAGSYHAQIETYEDFINSDCQMILLCVDSIFVEFYSKDELTIKTVYKNCIDYEFENIKFILPDEDSEKSMIAF